MPFTHLHVHTEFSLLDGASRIKELIETTKALGMDSIAITDHGAMYGVIDFYKEAKKQGVKPIIGCEVYVAPGARQEHREVNGVRYYHLILLADPLFLIIGQFRHAAWQSVVHPVIAVALL